MATAVTWSMTAARPSSSTRSGTPTGSPRWPTSKGVRITHVAETHIHNDYVSGGLALAPATGAAYLVNAADPVALQRGSPVRDGDTSGHRPGDAAAGAGHAGPHLHPPVLRAGSRRQVAGVFTGGSLLFGSTGRPDLLGPAHTGPLARAQHASAQRLAGELPDSAADLPDARIRQLLLGHAVRRPHPSTIGREKQVNSGADPRRDAYVDGAAGRPGRLPGLLRPHGPGEPGRARAPGPVPAAAGRARPSCAAGSRPANGWLTCGTGSRSRPVSCPARSASRWTAASPATWAGRCPGARR